MQDAADMDLLRDYVHRDSEEAFAMLVTRHVNMVYSAAQRKTGNASAAEEITQAVFIILARKADRLRDGTILSGWLYQATRLTSASFLRGEMRRACREQEAYMQSLSNEPEATVWPEIEPLLEDAMGRLGEKDRNALSLRFFEGRSFQEIGTAFGASENAAKKRVAHALEKLRIYFSKRGVVSTTAIIAGAISANSVQAAPALLANSVTAVAIAKGAAVSGSTLTLIKGALKLMAWSKVKTGVVVGMGVVLAAGTTVTINEIAAHKAEKSWRIPNIQPAQVDKLPPQVRILPTIFPPSDSHLESGSGLDKFVGTGVSVADIAGKAYGFPRGRIRFATGQPRDAYDFVATKPQGAAEALQRALEKKLGFVGRRETVETDVLLLKVKRPNAPGLRPAVVGPDADDHISMGGFESFDQPIFTDNKPFQGIGRFLEFYFGMPVIDQTGLTQHFNINLKWNERGGHAALKQALLDQLGLELVPSRESVEMLVVEKAK